jgi:4-hydroxybenzoate-CoA ligase
MAAAKLMGRHDRIRAHDVVFSAAKLFSPMAWATRWRSRCRSAGRACCRTADELVFEIMRRHRPSVFYAVPTLYAALLAQGQPGAAPTACGFAFPRARRCRRSRRAPGAAAAAGARRHRFDEMFQTFPSNRPDDGAMAPAASRCRADLRVVDETARELPDQEIGELIVRGPTAGEGY